MTGFIPEQSGTIHIPYFEDANADIGIQGHGTHKSVGQLQDEIRTNMGRLGAAVIGFTPGSFPGRTQRYGWRVEFMFGGQRGRIDVAALPIQSETAKKKDQAIRQALYNINESVKAQYMLTLLSPGAVPLLPYLLVAGTDKTVSQALQEQYDLPILGEHPELHLLEGEIVD